MNVQGACIASRMLTADGATVGFMYRRDPVFGTDSGWVFITGHETQTELDDPAQFVVCELATIADRNPDIVAFLDAPVGSAMERDAESGRFEPQFFPEDAIHGPELLSTRARQETDTAIAEYESSKTIPPAPEVRPAVDVEQQPDFCEKCGAPLEFGNVEIRSRTESSVLGGKPALLVALCPKCAEHRDGTGDRMIWGFAVLAAVLVVAGLIGWIASFFKPIQWSP